MILVANLFVCIFGTHYDNDKTYHKVYTEPLADLSITLCIKIKLPSAKNGRLIFYSLKKEK